MKRLSILAIFLLTASAAIAQGPNTTAPGPTQQREPGQNSNNLPNPGNPQTQVGVQNDTFAEEGTVEGTANESMAREEGTTTGTTGTTTQTTGQTTGTTTGTYGTGTATGATSLRNETETGTGVDVDVDTGANAAGAVDVDVTSTTDADTDASGIDETGTDTMSDTGSLPDTASELPLLAIAGLLALGASFMVRTAAKRNA